MSVTEDFRRHAFMMSTWYAFLGLEKISGHIDPLVTYSACRKGAEKGNPKAFDQWERWIQFWTPIRLTQ